MWHQKTITETEQVLHCDKDKGLTAWEHDHRLAKAGGNDIKRKKDRSAAVIFFRQFGDFMVMVLMAAAVVSAFLGETVDALMIVAIIVLNSVLGFVQEYKAERSLAALEKINEDEARAIIGGKLQVVKKRDLVVGDVVLLDSGAKVPADLRLTECHRLEIDESLLTGEAVPVAKGCDPVAAGAALAERTDMAYSGTVVTGGRGRGIVVETAMTTELGKIATMLEQGSTELTPLQKQLKQLGKVLILLCSALCALVAVAGALLGGDVYTMILTGVSLGVASIPEGLPIVVTICLALGVRRLTAVHAIVRRLPSVETLGGVTCICTDKTGTLTKNKMETKRFYADGQWLEVASLAAAGAVATDICLVLRYCNSLYCEGSESYGDPTEVALAKAAAIADIHVGDVEIEDEIAFDSERKLMTVIGAYKGRRISLVKGAPDRVVARCSALRGADGDAPLDDDGRQKLAAAITDGTADGSRLLALAIGENIGYGDDPEANLTFLGFAAIVDPLRENVPAALATAAAAGVRSIMLTGDQPGTAGAIGRQLGLVQGDDAVLTGKDLAALDDSALAKRLKRTAVIASVSPADKMRVVSVLRREGEICAMTGDGVNDAPALKEADIGIAMGKKGTDVTKSAADLVLADDDFSTIVEAIYQGRGIYANIRKFIRYLLASNLGEILVMVFSVVLRFPLPLLPLQILWINLVTDGFPALALAMERPDPSLMEKPPRRAGARFFDGAFTRGVLGRGLLFGVLCFAVFFVAIGLYGDIATARTMAFTALVLSQLLYVFDCRDPEGQIFGRKFFTNPFLWTVMLISFLLQGIVIYHPLCNALFHTVPLSGFDLVLTLAFSLIPSVLVMCGRLFFKKNKKNSKKNMI